MISTLQIEEGGLVAFESDIARAEYNRIKRMDGEFEDYLADLLENRLEETIDFGKDMSIAYIAEYFRRMFGDILYFDSLLSLTQQYGLWLGEAQRKV